MKPTPLKQLCRERHIQTYPSFVRAYDKSAAGLGDGFTGVRPSEKTFRRWLGGELAELPRVEHCVILEAMFPGWTARQLFGIDAPASADPDRRDALLASAEDSAAFLEWAEAGNIGELTLEQIEADVRSLSRAYLKTDTGPLYLRAVGLRDRLFELLRTGNRKPSQARELYAAAGWTLTFLSWVSIDLGQIDVAGTHLRAARFCADNAEHDLLRAWVAGTRHTAAFWQDDYATAARHAADGLRLAPRASGAALFLSSALALDLARLGDHEKAREVLIRAQEAADQLQAPNSDGLGGPFACLPGRAGGFWSDTYFALGEAQDALALADAAVETFEKLPPSERNAGSERMVRCQHVKAYLLMQEYDGAREALAPVLTTGPEHRVSPLVRRVSEIAALAQGNDSPLLQEVRANALEFASHGSQRSIG